MIDMCGLKGRPKFFQECLSFSVHAINCLRVELSVGYDADFPFSYFLTARVQKRQLISFVKKIVLGGCVIWMWPQGVDYYCLYSNLV